MNKENYVRLPDSCCKTKEAPAFEVPNDAIIHSCDCEGCAGLVIQFAASAEDAMPSAFAKDVKADLEKKLGSDKRIVKVEDGKTCSGVQYVYDVLWRKSEGKDGIEYLLNMNLFFEGKTIYVGALMSRKDGAETDTAKDAIKELIEFIIKNN